MPINKRLKREFRKSFAKYILIALVILLGIMIIAGFFSSVDGTQTIIAKNRDEYNVEDAGIEVLRKLNQKEIKKIQDLGAKEMEDNSYVNIQSSKDKDYQIRVFKVRNKINKLNVMKGSLPKNSGEIVLEKKTAAAKKVTVGDYYNILDNKSYKVTGLVTAVDYNNVLENVSSGVANFNTFGIGFVTEKEFNDLADEKVNYQYSIKTDDKDDIEKITNYLKDEKIYKNVLKNEYNPRIQSVDDRSNNIKSEIVLISLIFFVLIAFVLYVMTSSLVDKDSNYIGTLFSMGYTKNEIVRHYMIIPLLLTIIGSGLGTLLGYLFVADYIGDSIFSRYSIPDFHRHWDVFFVSICFFVPIILQIILNYCLLSKKLKITPSQLMSGKGKSGFVYRKVKLTGLSFFKKMYIRIFLRGLKNQIILLFGVLIAMFLLIMGLALKDTLNDHIKDVKENPLYKNVYILKSFINDKNNDYQKATLENFRVKYRNVGMDLTVYGMDVNDRIKNIPTAQDEMIVSDSTASKLSLKKGGTFKVYSENLKKYLTFKVVDIIHDPVGLNGFMDRKSLNKLMEKEDPQEYYNAIISNEDLQLPDSSVQEVVTQSNKVSAAKEMNDMMQSMIKMLIIVSIVVFTALMYMLLNMVIEKSEYSISLMKIFGYTRKENNRFYLTSFMISITVFLIVSMIIDSNLFIYVWPVLNSNLVGFVPVRIHLITYIILFILGIASYLSVTILLKAKINKISMGKILKQRD